MRIMTKRERERYDVEMSSMSYARASPDYRSVVFSRNKGYKNIYLFVLYVYIYLLYISFFASPSVPLVSRIRICTKKKKHHPSPCTRAFASLLTKKKAESISDCFLALVIFAFMLAISVAEFGVIIKSCERKSPETLNNGKQENNINNNRIIKG